MKLSVKSALGLTALLLATATTRQADAAVMFSFAGVPMDDGVAEDPALSLSGSFVVPALNPGVLSGTGWIADLISVNFTVTDGGTVIGSFTDPTQLQFASGVGANGQYTIDVESIIPSGDFLGLTIMDQGVTSADVYVPSFSIHGYSFETFPSGTPVAVSVVDEPGTGSLLTVAMAGVMALVWNRRASVRPRGRHSVVPSWS